MISWEKFLKRPSIHFLGGLKRSASLADSSMSPKGRVQMLPPFEVLTPMENRFLTGEDCAVEQTLAVDPLAPLLAGDAAAAA
jgi:hypothetical protein